MREAITTQPQQITVDTTPTHVYMERILAKLTLQPRLRFAEVFEPPFDRERLLGWFLAMLELIKQHEVSAEQPDLFGEIWIVRSATSATTPPPVESRGEIA
jgi:segregation and condensation protein A